MATLPWSTLRERFAWPLVAGDALAFVVFAALGHRDHGESSAVLSVIGTALPFIGGWLLVAPWVGVFHSVGKNAVRVTLRRTAIGWLLAWPAALLLRAIVLQRSIPLSFALVALLANCVLLVGWRAVYTWLTHVRQA